VKIWLKSKSGSLLGVIWNGNPGPILATVVSTPLTHNHTQERNVFFHQKGFHRGFPVYEEKE
jgi:hypothetical protein